MKYFSRITSQRLLKPIILNRIPHIKLTPSLLKALFLCGAFHIVKFKLEMLVRKFEGEIMKRSPSIIVIKDFCYSYQSLPADAGF